MRNLYKWIFNYTDKVQFKTNKSIEESVRKMSERIKEEDLLVILSGWIEKPTVFGKVTKDDIRLHRVIPRFRNTYKPHFYGKFIEVEGKTILEGVFTMSYFSRIGAMISLIIVAITEIIIILSAIESSDDPQVWKFALIFHLAIGLGMGVAALIKRFSKKDVEYISNEIKKALE